VWRKVRQRVGRVEKVRQRAGRVKKGKIEDRKGRE
jgi:hypothetical protein